MEETQRAEIIKSLKSELETYKKIAEKISNLLVTTNINYICANTPDEKCNGYQKDNIKCEQCIIDWARKEVDENVE